MNLTNLQPLHHFNCCIAKTIANETRANPAKLDCNGGRMGYTFSIKGYLYQLWYGIFFFIETKIYIFIKTRKKNYGEELNTLERRFEQGKENYGLIGKLFMEEYLIFIEMKNKDTKFDSADVETQKKMLKQFLEQVIHLLQ